ncbi:hypothetical protein [Acidithiobacillus caldus]|uniref:hypothetical protein n=1 Tax=Acidithiobacillus caldus TaxID=33059 RepID=UPI0007DA057E|nr:hypothetical protein [Acidithiobacillus caldus]QER44978.1 hypothetical protein F0726_01918 [Acidithiobacillus caldus]
MEAVRRRSGGDRFRDAVIYLLLNDGFSVQDSSYEQDMHEASDLLIDGAGCALRIRSEKALQRWPDQFTIRATRPGCGADTEFCKILAGHARYALYGFCDGENRVVLLRLLDLDVFRRCILGNPEQYDRNLRFGRDGVGYLVFCIDEFPADLVVRTWDYRH